MAAEVQNDAKAQVFHNASMLQDPDKHTALIGVVHSESFADTDLDYYVGKGGLAGVMGLPLSSQGMSSAANDKWLKLNSDMRMKGSTAEKLPLFCWIDSVQSEIESQSKDEAWMQMDDVVGPVPSRSSIGGSLHDGIPRAGMAVLLKICGALANMDYPADVVSKVGSLVRRNLMTVIHYDSLKLPVEVSSGDDEWIEARIDALLRSLLSPKQERRRSVNINSNEPVLLINNFGNLHHEQLRDVVQTTLDRLHKDWNVWPVRVYAGAFLVGKVKEEHSENGFSITLLNVVNTDIGGPSMIDLLDASSDAPIWSYRLHSFFKESWRDRQLVDRSDTGPPLSRSPSAESLSEQSDEDANLGNESLAADERRSSDDQEPGVASAEEGKASPPILVDDEDARSDEFSRDLTKGEATTNDDDLVWDDVRASFDARNDGRVVAHPTFSNPSGAESLLDLVRSQAEGMIGTTKRSEKQLDQAEAASEQGQKDKSDSGDFVVV